MTAAPKTEPDTAVVESILIEAVRNAGLTGGSLFGLARAVRDESAAAESLGDAELDAYLQSRLGARWEAESGPQPHPDALRLIPVERAREQGLLPLEQRGDSLRLAALDPCDLDALADLRLVTGLRASALPADQDELDKAIDLHFRGRTAGAQDKAPASAPSAPKASAAAAPRGETNPIVALVRDLILDAMRMGSSDIHLEPFERDMQVRFRQDGVLRVHRTIHARNKSEVVSRIKIMAQMDIAERRRPQDGRIRVEGPSGPVDLRVSTLPTDHGEKVVMRILDKGAVPLDLAALGLGEAALGHLERALRQPFGLILMTGPTGAGKTTTLYASLNRIKSPEVNIVTVEDPIEYKLDGVIQTAVKSEIDYTFANALRTILRQDPNVILVGEIRDRETAEIAIRASLTGHLVLSTLHANDAASAATRLIDMGIEPFLLSSAITLIGAQRLVRRVCPHCAEPASPAGIAEGDIPPGAAYRRGRGCASCGRTGYAGRVGAYEILPVSDALRGMINQRKDAQALREAAEAEGMVTMRRDGLIKAAAGLTTIEEVLRETST